MKLGTIEIEETDLVTLLRSHDVERLSVFGSSLRDDFSVSSDIDLLVVFKNSQVKSLFDLIGLRLALEDLLKRKVDLLEEGGIINPFRKKEITSTAKVIYAA